MPITIPNDLPAKEILISENIFAIDANRAKSQDIRPLRFLILNLMPKKIETETQLLRLISKTSIQIEVDFLKIDSHVSKNTSEEHLLKFYDTFDHVKDQCFDGMIVTGAPVEHLQFEDVDYWSELTDIMNWAKTNVFSTMFICWGAQAALYHYYNIPKLHCDSKIFGVDKQRLIKHNALTSGFDEEFNMPQSRHTMVDELKLQESDELDIIAGSHTSGSTIISTKNIRQIFVSGHLEYTRNTLSQEYNRDVEQGKEIQVPFNYFLENNPTNQIVWNWKSHANLLYRNWINYVYQLTPYEIDIIKEIVD